MAKAETKVTITLSIEEARLVVAALDCQSTASSNNPVAVAKAEKYRRVGNVIQKEL